MSATVTSEQAPGRRAHVAVIVVFFAHGLLFASWTAHIPHIKAHLGIDDGVLGVALLGTPIGSVGAVTLAARLIPRLGSRRVVQLALVGYCLVGPIVGVTGNVAGLFVALLAWGAFQGMLDVAMNTQAIAVEGQRQLVLMNGIHAWWSIGAFVGAGVGALGVALGVGLSLQLLVLGVPVMVLAGLLTARMLSDSTVTADDDADQPVGRRISAAMLTLGAIAFASMLCEGAAADWSSVYLHDSLGAGAGIAGLGYTVFAFAMFIIRLSGNRLLGQLPVERLLPMLAIAAAAVFGAALAVDSIPVVIAGFFALGLGLGTIVPSAFSAAGRLPGIHPGVGVAGVSGLGWAGFVLGPPLIGQLAGATSLGSALILLPVLTALVAVGCARAPALR